MEPGSHIALGPVASGSARTLTRELGAAGAPSGSDAGERLMGASPRRAGLNQATADVGAALASAVAAAVVAEARVRSLTNALEDALELLVVAEEPSVSQRQRQLEFKDLEREHLVEALSPREREVLALIATGRSNKAIADELFVSPNTIKTHVASLLTKLRADTRVQLAVIAARQMVL